MQHEIVFLPVRRGASVRHVALIFSGFFIIAQLLFLDSLQARIAFTVACAVFLLLGFFLSGRMAGNWPQEIVINRSGIAYGNMKVQHGIDLIPWNEIARMDIFYSDARLPPHLRIGLRPGAFRDRLQKPFLQRLSMGLDVNIPVSVNATPEAVLQTAKQFWQASTYSRR